MCRFISPIVSPVAAAAPTPEGPNRRAAAGGQGRRTKASAAGHEDGADGSQEPQEHVLELNIGSVSEVEQGDAGLEGVSQRAAAEQSCGLEASEDQEQQPQRQTRQHKQLLGEQHDEQQQDEEEQQQQQQHQVEAEQIQQEQHQHHVPQSPISLPVATTHRADEGSGQGFAGPSSDSDVSDSDLDLDDDGIMGQLAASIRQALSSRAGGASNSGSRAQQHKQEQQQKQQGPTAEGSGPALPHWQPVTGLQLPAAAARAGLGAGEVVGGRLPRTVQQQKEANTSRAPASAVAVAGTEGVVGQVGSLSKSLYAPTLDPVKAGKEAKKVAPDTAGEGQSDTGEPQGLL